MTLNQLVCRAASVYPDAYPLEYFDLGKSAPKANPNDDDKLAQFIAFELAETFDPAASEGEQIAAAVKTMQRASDELATVAHALSDLTSERMAA